MEMSQRIPFWYQISIKMFIFWENHKKSLFGKKKSWTGYKNNFDLKMLKLLENHVKAKVMEGFPHFLIKALFWKFVITFCQNFQK